MAGGGARAHVKSALFVQNDCGSQAAGAGRVLPPHDLPGRRAGPVLLQSALDAELHGATAPQNSRGRAQRQERRVQVLGAELQNADAPRSPRGHAQRQAQQRAQTIDAEPQSDGSLQAHGQTQAQAQAHAQALALSQVETLSLMARSSRRPGSAGPQQLLATVGALRSARSRACSLASQAQVQAQA